MALAFTSDQFQRQQESYEMLTNPALLQLKSRELGVSINELRYRYQNQQLENCQQTEVKLQNNYKTNETTTSRTYIQSIIQQFRLAVNSFQSNRQDNQPDNDDDEDYEDEDGDGEDESDQDYEPNQ